MAKAAYDFAEGQQLPLAIPPGYNQKLTNRIFKRRVIDMICNLLLEHCSPLPLSKVCTCNEMRTHAQLHPFVGP